MEKVAVTGVITPRGLGDALQYYVIFKLLQKSCHEAEITFLCPDLKNGLFVFKNLNLNANLIDLGYIGKYNIFLYLSRLSSSYKDTSKLKRRNMAKVQTKKANVPLRIIRAIGRKYEEYFSSYVIDKYINSYFMKSFSFDASIFGGHTVTGSIYPSIYKYEALRSITKGPVVTSPISISKLALEYFEQRTSKFKKTIMLKRLKQSLQKLDFIYTRGPYSLEMLRDYLNINEEKVAMALDSGFGVRVIHPYIKPKFLKNETLKILIIPRKNYFYIYKKEGLYKSYLNALAGLISWLSRNFDAEVYLTSQTIDVKHDMMGGQAAVNDLLSILKKRDNKYLKYLKSVKPTGLVSACRLFSSMDLVISSYMHGGIMALGLGVPAFFILPSTDIKVLDILSFVGLDVNSFLIDAFDANSLKAENFVNKIGRVVENLKFHKKSLEHAINKAMPTIELPVKKLIGLSG